MESIIYNYNNNNNKQTFKHVQITDAVTKVWVATTHKNNLQRTKQIGLKETPEPSNS